MLTKQSIGIGEDDGAFSCDLSHCQQGGEGRLPIAENLRSLREIQSSFNLLGRCGKIIIIII